MGAAHKFRTQAGVAVDDGICVQVEVATARASAIEDVPAAHGGFGGAWRADEIGDPRALFTHNRTERILQPDGRKIERIEQDVAALDLGPQRRRRERGVGPPSLLSFALEDIRPAKGKRELPKRRISFPAETLHPIRRASPHRCRL